MRLRGIGVALMLGALWGCDPMSSPPMVEGDGEPFDGGVGTDGGERVDAWVTPLRLNHIQVRGTVNSNHDYHPDNPYPQFQYRHLPFEQQGSVQDIRQFDFDLFGDGHTLWVLYYAALEDAETICNVFATCLRGLAAFREANPRHLPLILLIGETLPITDANPNPFFWHVDEIEESLIAILGRDAMYSPADVRGAHPDLATAIQRDGWPQLADARGKVIAVLNEYGAARQEYLTFGGENPEDRFLWQIGDPDAELPDEVIFSFERADADDLPTIERLVDAGRLVHASTNDPAMVPLLRAAGVHMLASRWPDDVLGPLDPHPARCNPATAPDDCRPGNLERRARADEVE